MRITAPRTMDGGRALSAEHATQLRRTLSAYGVTGTARLLRAAPTTVEKLDGGYGPADTVARIARRLDELADKRDETERCPRCNEAVSDRTPCGCSFTPHDPRFRGTR